MFANKATVKSFNTHNSINKPLVRSKISADNQIYEWSNTMDRVRIIRGGIPYSTLEMTSARLNRPVKRILSIINIPQTTYNKKKSEHALLNSRDTELVILINELIDYGIEVFNQEKEKFQRWLQKPNLSLNGNIPEDLLDTATGIEEVRFALNRIEFGSFA